MRNYKVNIFRFKAKKALYLILIFFSFLPSINKTNFAQETNFTNNNFIKSQEKIFEDEIKIDYLLGPGDKLLLKFFGIDFYDNIYSIDSDGFLNLPEINKVYASNKTLKELEQLLNKKYEEFIINPKIDLKIVFYRPVNVYIKGEVKTPGLYTLFYSDKRQYNDLIGNTTPRNFEFDNLNSDKTTYFPPKLFEALKLSKGITNYADLSNIEIIRKNSASQGGGKISTKINFLKLIRDGNQEININVQDGDIITVGKNKNLLKDQILSINKTNLTPDKMIVFISGNVTRPGAIELDQGSSLVQAVYKAGGEKYFTGKINHIRFNDQSRAEKNVFSFNPNAAVKTKQNPILLNGDIINVNKTIVGKTTSAIKELANPIITTNAIINIFD